MFEQVVEHMKRFGTQGDRQPGPGQGIELGIEETIGEGVAHGAILCAAPVLLAAPYVVSDCTGTYTVPSDDLHFDIFIAPTGEELIAIATSPNFIAVQGPNRRVSHR
jgi:hypothetical protein